MALLNHPGIPLATFGEVPGNLVAFMAKQLGVPAGKFAGYAERVQTATDHALELMTGLGLRPSAEDDLNLMIEAGARAAWSTEGGFEIATAIVAALRSAGKRGGTAGDFNAHYGVDPGFSFYTHVSDHVVVAAALLWLALPVDPVHLAIGDQGFPSFRLSVGVSLHTVVWLVLRLWLGTPVPFKITASDEIRLFSVVTQYSPTDLLGNYCFMLV